MRLAPGARTEVQCVQAVFRQSAHVRPRLLRAYRDVGSRDRSERGQQRVLIAHAARRADVVELDRDIAESARLSITGTPTFLINGKFVSGAQPFENFQALVERELALTGT